MTHQFFFNVCTTVNLSLSLSRRLMDLSIHGESKRKRKQQEEDPLGDVIEDLITED
jgi:hypothetical protein